jgi:hypothetical protein
MKCEVEFEIPDGYTLDLDNMRRGHDRGDEYLKIPLKKVKPHRIVLEATGERRCPKMGEHFMSHDGGINTAVFDFREDECEIYRLVEDSEK